MTTTPPPPAIPRPCGIDPNIECPPEPTLQEQVVDLLHSIGLSETSEIGSNTPLDIIRHFAAAQNYEYAQALSWATDSTPLLYVFGIVLAVEKIATAFNGEAIVGGLFLRNSLPVFRFVIWGALGIFGWSAASQLLTGITPLVAREYAMATLWVASIALTAFKAMFWVEALAVAFWAVKAAVDMLHSLAMRLTGRG